MNIIIELHDSTVAEIDEPEGTGNVQCLPAYLHQSEGRPVLDSGSGWIQDARLIFADASASRGFPDLPCGVMNGELVIGGERPDTEIPVPLEVTAPTALRLVFDSINSVAVAGGGVRLELFGQPRYIEGFNPWLRRSDMKTGCHISAWAEFQTTRLSSARHNCWPGGDGLYPRFVRVN